MTFRSLFLSLVGLVILVPMAAGAEMPKEQMYSLVNEGNAAFRQGNSLAAGSDEAARLYQKAILIFERLIGDGEVRNSKLYYNLANAYFLKGDIGRAILNYRRGERIDNSDADIQKNLAFARSRRIDKVEVRTEKRVLRTLFFWHYDLSIKSKFLTACISFAILCVGLTIMVWRGRVGAGGIVMIAAFVLAVCFFGSAVLEAKGLSNRICGVIVADEVVARQGDGQNYQASFKEPLHAGTEFDLIERRAGWFNIRLANDNQAWIPQGSGELL